MRTELPECKRCCFCLPLRFGLLTWGYIRLGLSMFLFIGLFIAFYEMLDLVITGENVPLNITHTIILTSLLLLTISDILLNTVFITGGHKKDMKLMRAYYIYSFILCILTFLLWIASVTSTLLFLKVSDIDFTFYIYIALVDTTTLLALVLAQVYVLLLVRSEIIKLRSHYEFRFVNNAAEAECTLKCEELNMKEEPENKNEIYVPELYN